MARIKYTGTTNSSGVAQATVTGTGGGRLKFISRTGDLWSNPYGVLDCLFKDMGTTSDHNDSWNNSGGNVTVVRTDTETILTRTASTNGFYQTQINNPHCEIDFDYMQNGTSQMTSLRNGNTVVKWITYSEFNLSANVWYHITLTINGTSLVITVDGVSKSFTLSSAPNWFVMRLMENEEIRYKNFKVYPLFTPPEHYTPIALSSSASIIQTGDSATLTAELTNVLGEKLANKNVDFIEKVEHIYETINTGDNVISLALPSKFKIEFDLEVTGTSSTSNAFIRFNSSTGLYCGKGSSSSNNITFFGTTLEQISGKTTYTIEYDNGKAVCSSPTNRVTIINLSLTSLYSLSRNGDTVISNINVYYDDTIGTGTTNNNGIATCNNHITGTGKGLRQVIASNGIIQSETYATWDTIWYDKDSATWNVSKGSTSYSDNTRSITLNSNSGLANPSVNGNSFFIPCIDDFIVEFDYSQGNISLYFAVSGQVYNMGMSLNFAKYNNKTLKLLVKPSEDKIDVYIDGVYDNTITNSRTFSGKDYCGLHIRTNWSSGATGTFGNLKIYKA